MADASKDGIILDKQWLATKDERTRDSHAHLDGEIRKWNERFSNGLRYPQDPQGEAGEVYNCRCAMREITRGFYNKYTGKTVMLPDAPQDEYAAESKAYWNKYFAEKKQKESALAAAENPNYSNKLLKNDGKNGIIQINETTLDFKRRTQVRASSVTEKTANGDYSTKLSHQQHLRHIEGTKEFEIYKDIRISKDGNPQSVITISEEEDHI
ncbi:MAG: hypothetical protein IJ050_10525 [Clostridia bacterium]|nr:hypothetical protein [Clostridia bacterium]